MPSRVGRGPFFCVVQGYRALLLTFFYFQYVARRYRVSQMTVQTVTLLVQKVDGIAAHRLVPAPLHAVYSKAKWAVGKAAERIQ